MCLYIVCSAIQSVTEFLCFLTVCWWCTLHRLYKKCIFYYNISPILWEFVTLLLFQADTEGVYHLSDGIYTRRLQIAPYKGRLYCYTSLATCFILLDTVKLSFTTNTFATFIFAYERFTKSLVMLLKIIFVVTWTVCDFVLYELKKNVTSYTHLKHKIHTIQIRINRN